LAGTIEEKMHERAKRMTNLEHHVSHLEDDYGMREIIQGASLIPVTKHERSGPGQMAPLDEPQRLWGRSGWRESLSKSGFSTGNDRFAGGPIAPDTLAPAKRLRKKKNVRLTVQRAQSPIVPIPVLPTTQSTAGSGPIALDNGIQHDHMHNNDNNEDDEPLMTQWMHRPQETQDAVEGGHEEVQNHTLPAAAFAGDQAAGKASIDTDLLGARVNSNQLSFAELLN
jgi:hypothetical protein